MKAHQRKYLSFLTKKYIKEMKRRSKLSKCQWPLSQIIPRQALVKKIVCNKSRQFQTNMQTLKEIFKPLVKQRDCSVTSLNQIGFQPADMHGHIKRSCYMEFNQQSGIHITNIVQEHDKHTYFHSSPLIQAFTMYILCCSFALAWCNKIPT